MSTPLDHIIYLASPGALDQAVAAFEEFGFTVISGGKHADGLTENALVTFSDGVYIELISFTKPVGEYEGDSEGLKKRKSHWWASMKENGWIDWSLGDTVDETIHEPISKAVNTRAINDGVQVHYEEGREGGRIKPDGVVLKWKVTFPSQIHRRGGLPFFCKDLTPREYRVPSAPSHASNALGIGSLTLMTSTDDLLRFTSELTTVIGTAPERTEGGIIEWKLNSPSSSKSITLRLEASRDEEQIAWVESVNGIGIYKVGVIVGMIGDLPNVRELDMRRLMPKEKLTLS